MLSMIRTPGITGWLGKWPWNHASLIDTFLMPIADTFLMRSTTRSIKKEGIAVRNRLHNARDVDDLLLVGLIRQGVTVIRLCIHQP